MAQLAPSSPVSSCVGQGQVVICVDAAFNGPFPLKTKVAAVKDFLAEVNRHTAVAALAWTQFLIVVTVIPEGDRMRFPEIALYTDKGTPITEWDKGVFGSVCILLNVIALCFMAIPSSGRHDIESNAGWESSPLSKQDMMRLLVHLGYAGPLLWAGSFLSLLMYIHRFYAYTALVVIAATICYSIAYVLIVMAWRAINRRL